MHVNSCFDSISTSYETSGSITRFVAFSVCRDILVIRGEMRIVKIIEEYFYGNFLFYFIVRKSKKHYPKDNFLKFIFKSIIFYENFYYIEKLLYKSCFRTRHQCIYWYLGL